MRPGVFLLPFVTLNSLMKLLNTVDHEKFPNAVSVGITNSYESYFSLNF